MPYPKRWLLCWQFVPVRLVLALLLSLNGSTLLQAQQNSRQLTRWPQDTLVQDSLIIVPQSLQMRWASTGSPVPESMYKLDNHVLIWLGPKSDSLQIFYRVLAYDLERRLFHKQNKPAMLGDTLPGVLYDPLASKGGNFDVFNTRGLDYSGSFARGLSFGNNQSLVLNSNFNLQLSGKLSDDIEVTAALTDNAIPLQPDGNTQQIQDFDKVFIQVKKDKTKLTAGDYELNRPANAYFLNYIKKLKGATLETQFGSERWGTLAADASAAVSRGRFGRNTFQGGEGNQGPYRLTGNDGERFIIILSGTERVFIDGKLMERGLDRDYIIDYNLGEITFTTNRLITKDSRIQIEFEYADQNYLRSLYAANMSWTKGPWKAHLHLFNEQDNKNQPSQFNLSDTDKQRLAQAGDNAELALANSIDTIAGGYNPQVITYLLRDTLVAGTLFDSVLVYSTNPQLAIYTASFAFVGQGKGYYSLAQTSANGRVYRWVAPDASGNLQGDYMPIVRLVTPKRQQLYALGLDYSIGKTGLLQGEVAYTQNDLNSFSALDAANDDGLAVRLSAKQSFTLKQALDTAQQKVKLLSLDLEGHYEYLSQHFQFIEPYRPREFTRDWNTSSVRSASAEHLGSFGLSLNSKRWGTVFYQAALFSKDTVFQGQRHSLGSRLLYKGFGLESNSSVLLSQQGSTERSMFIRPRFDLYKRFAQAKDLKIGLYWERESNARLDIQADTLLASAFRFDVFKAYAELPQQDNIPVQLSAYYQRRYDDVPDSTRFKNLTIGDEAGLNGAWKIWQNANLRWNFTYRNLFIQDTALTDLKPQQTYLGRAEYDMSLLKGAVRLNTIYELGSGQQRKTEYNYLRVNQGEGNFTWLDRNNDSIPQLNEFEQSVFQDQASYVRVISFTDEFIRTNNIQFSQSLSLNPKSLWFNKKKGTMLKFLSRLSSQSVFNIDRRTLADASIPALDPFRLAIADSLLVSINSSMRNTLFFNRSDPRFSFEVTQSDLRNKNVLATGYEARRRSEWLLKLRWNLLPSLSLQVQASTGRQDNDSELFADRDYQIAGKAIKPELSWMFKRKLRLSSSYQYRVRNNLIGSQEVARSNEIAFDLTYNQSGKSDLRAKFSYVGIVYSGANNTPVSFAMLDALQKGNNFIWSLTFRRSLSKVLELNLGYEGRKTGESKMVHTGRMQIRATF